MVIVNELIYAENLLKNGFSLPYHKRFKDIFILVKYYKYIGTSINKTQDNIFSFLNKFDNEFDINVNNKDREKVFKIVHSVYNKNYKFRIINDINISQKEYELINSIKNKQLKRLLCVFCVLHKIYGIKYNLRVLYSDLSNYANIKSLARINALIKQLEEMQLIEEQEGCKFDLFFVDDENNVDINNYGICSNCGVLIYVNSSNKKYCSFCAKYIQFNQKKEWDRNKRIRKAKNS